jgi:membrane protein DedA with SNARE-associated domain
MGHSRDVLTLSLPFATATADKAATFIALFLAQVASWAGVPALGAAASGAAAALASQGTIHLWAVLVVGTAGAEVGSLGGWWLGNRIAHAGLDGNGRFDDKRRKALAAGGKVEQRWGRLIVFFVPSWVSGALGMSLRQFATWNLLAALLWNVGAALAAYGVASAASGKAASHVVIALVLALAIAGLTVLLFRSFRRRHGAAAQPPVAPVEGDVFTPSG